MTLIPTPDWMQPPRLEIRRARRDVDGRATFELVFHDHGPAVVWTGHDYSAAILAAEDWERQGAEVVDTVAGFEGELG